MSRKFNIKQIVVILSVITIFLLETQFFYLIRSEILYEIINPYQKITIVLLIVTSCSILFIDLLNFKRFIFNKHVFFFLILFFIEIVRTVYKYNVGIIPVISSYNYLFIILGYYIFRYYIQRKGKENFINLVLFFSLFCSILISLQYILYPKLGLFLNVDYSYRFLSMRITQGEGLINIGIVLAFGVLVNKNFKFMLLPYLTFLVGVYELIFVQKTRMVILCIIISCITVFLLKNVKKVQNVFLLFIFLFILLGTIQNTELLNKYTESISNEDVSLRVRQEANSFFLNQFYENKFLGMGLIPSNVSDFTDNLLYGPNRIYFKSDVGLVGFINTFGISGLICFLLLYFKIITILIKSIKNGSIRNNYEVLTLSLFVITSSWTLLIFNYQRIITLPILLAVLDYVVYQTYKIKKNNYSS